MNPATTEEPPSEELQLAPEQPGEPHMKQLAPFASFETQARKLAADAAAVALLEPNAANAMVARTMRLQVRPFRTSIERRHAELKRPVIDEGNRLDDAKNQLMEILKPIEAKLLAIEQFAELEAKRIQDEKRIARLEEITPYLTAPLAIDLGVVLDDRYAAMLQDAKDAHAARLVREQKEKEDQAAAAKKLEMKQARALELAPLVRFIKTKITDLGELSQEAYECFLEEGRDGEKKEKEEMEAQRLETERLKKEAVEREEAARKEREAAATEKARIDRLHKERFSEMKKFDKAPPFWMAQELGKMTAQEFAELRDNHRKLHALAIEAEAEAAERERIKAEKTKAEAAERERVASAEREAIAKEHARLAGIAEKQRQEAAEARAELQRQKDATAKLEADRGSAEKAAAMAPEKDKLMVLAETIRSIPLPPMTTESGKLAMLEIQEKRAHFAKWVEKKANELGGELL